MQVIESLKTCFESIGPVNLRTTNLKSSNICWDVANFQRKAGQWQTTKGLRKTKKTKTVPDKSIPIKFEGTLLAHGAALKVRITRTINNYTSIWSQAYQAKLGPTKYMDASAAKPIRDPHIQKKNSLPCTNRPCRYQLQPEMGVPLTKEVPKWKRYMLAVIWKIYRTSWIGLM